MSRLARLTWPTGWRTGLSPCRCPAWCRHCCHMTLPGRCNWAGRRWGRRGCGSRSLTGWHLSPGLLPGDRTREHLRGRKTRKRSWEQSKVSELNATRRLRHAQLVISKKHLQSKTVALDSIRRLKVTSAAFVLLRIFSGNFGEVTCLCFSTSKRRRRLKIFLAELFLINQFSFEVTNHLVYIISLFLNPHKSQMRIRIWKGFGVFLDPENLI